MSELIVIEFQSNDEACAARKRLLQMQSQHQADVADAVIATVDDDGHIRLDQMVNQWTVNAKGGGLIGLLYGAMFMHPILGAVIGASAITMSNAVADYGINDEFMTDTAKISRPGRSLLFVFLRNMSSDRLIDEIASGSGKIIRTEIDQKAVEHLSHAPNVKATNGQKS